MIIDPQIRLNRLILSLSRVLDFIHPNVMDHQLRVAYIAVRIAQQMDLDKDSILQLLIAGTLHDIGLVGVENRISGLQKKNWEALPWHSEAGYIFLHENELFRHPAKIIRYHHNSWNNGRGSKSNGQQVPFLSHILVLADSIERMIDRSEYIIDQRDSIKSEVCSNSVSTFHPDCVEAFIRVSETESFWLDIVSPKVYDILCRQVIWPELTLAPEKLEPIAKIFASIIDATSRWTATHSAGVSSAAVEISKQFKFSPRQQSLMRSAGYLHDIGKLTVPTKILDKPEKLTTHERNILKSHTYYTFHFLNDIGSIPQISEWAAFHHERLDGNGYPFHHKAKNLSLGARIMAIADVFGALTEDRPYHKAMPRDKVLNILKKLAGSEGLDGDIVNALEKNYDAVYDRCFHNRAVYNERQKHLLESIQ